MMALRSKHLVCLLLLACLVVFGATAHAAGNRTIHVWLPTTSESLSARQMIYLTKRVEERLPGRFTFVTTYAPASPGEAQLLTQVRRGEIDIAVLSDALIDEVPRLTLFRLPWLFDSAEHLQQSLYAGLEDEVRTHVEETLKIVVVGLYQNGFHHIRADRAILGPDDFAQRKILVNDGRKMRDAMRAMGAIPQKYPAQSAADAIQHGVVDSFDGTMDVLTRLPIGSNMPIVSLTRHVYEPTFVIASQTFWARLNDAERAALTDCGVGFSDTAAQIAATFNEAARKRVPGLRFQTVNPDRFKGFAAQQRAAYEKAYGTDWMEFVDIGRDAASPASP